MSTLWTPASARPGRATLPHGDVTLRAGVVLTWCAACASDQERAYRAAGIADPHVGVWQGAAATAAARRKTMMVMASLDPTDRWGDLLHVSISLRDRNPSWTEIRLVKDSFYGPYRDAMMVLPREADYVNVHTHCFHLWETPERWGSSEPRGARRTLPAHRKP